MEKQQTYIFSELSGGRSTSFDCSNLKLVSAKRGMMREVFGESLRFFF